MAIDVKFEFKSLPQNLTGYLSEPSIRKLLLLINIVIRTGFIPTPIHTGRLQSIQTGGSPKRAPFRRCLFESKIQFLAGPQIETLKLRVDSREGLPQASLGGAEIRDRSRPLLFQRNNNFKTIKIALR